MVGLRILSLALALPLVGCGDNLVGAPPLGFSPRAPGRVDVVGYPPAPDEGYSGDEGGILPNMRFQGYLTEGPSEVPVHDLSYRETVTFSDIRAIEGHTHMLITVAAEWCKPCREEAEILPELYDEWGPRGGYVLGVLNQDRLYNTADRRSVEDWSRRYQSNYSLTHDPEGFVAQEFAPSTVPLNVVVDLRTMEVLRSRVGEDPDTFRFFEDLLGD